MKEEPEDLSLRYKVGVEGNEYVMELGSHYTLEESIIKPKREPGFLQRLLSSYETFSEIKKDEEGKVKDICITAYEFFPNDTKTARSVNFDPNIPNEYINFDDEQYILGVLDSEGKSQPIEDLETQEAFSRLNLKRRMKS